MAQLELSLYPLGRRFPLRCASGAPWKITRIFDTRRILLGPQIEPFLMRDLHIHMENSTARGEDRQAPTCYMCDATATSNEHAPPQCIFPNGHRKNLITVPSCDVHNSEKSKDDEYVRLILSASHAGRPQHQQGPFEKALRGLKYSPHLFEQFLLKGRTYRALVDGEPTMAFTVDYERFSRVMEHTARAVYFHHFGAKWSEQLRILAASGVFPPDRARAPEQNARVLALAKMDPGTPKFGDNPEIFFYQFWTDADPLQSSLRMAFFGGFVVFAVPLSRMNASPFAGVATAPPAPP